MIPHLVVLLAILLASAPSQVAAQRAPRGGLGANPQTQARGFTATEPIHNFYFTRGIFSGGRSWSTDAPSADRWIAAVVQRLTFIDSAQRENYVALDDPNLNRFPFLYILEVGGMQLRESEVVGLRDYLLKGGFVMVDDFWGSYQWLNWEQQIRRVLPEYEIVDIPMTHPIFSTVYDVDEIVQVPVVGRGCDGGPTHQGDGRSPTSAVSLTMLDD